MNDVNLVERFGLRADYIALRHVYVIVLQKDGLDVIELASAGTLKEAYMHAARSIACLLVNKIQGVSVEPGRDSVWTVV